MAMLSPDSETWTSPMVLTRCHAAQPEAVLADPTRAATIRHPNGRSVLWGCVDSTGPGYRGARAEDAAQASLIRQQNEVPGNRQSTLALAA